MLQDNLMVAEDISGKLFFVQGLPANAVFEPGC